MLNNPGVFRVPQDLVLIPETALPPTDAPSTLNGFPARFDPTTGTLWVFDGAAWKFTVLD